LVEYERIVLLDADMTVQQNMDELMDLDLPDGHIAAAHACACNPHKFAHYPKDWIPANCAYASMVAPHCLAHPPENTPSSPRPYRLLNSGLVVLRPSTATFERLKEFLHTSPEIASFKFPDQDLLAAFFLGRWKPLPYIYNALKTSRTVHPRMWRDEDVKCVHYVLKKPWEQGGKAVENNYHEIHMWWWAQWDLLGKEMNRDDGPLADKQGWAYISRSVFG